MLVMSLFLLYTFQNVQSTNVFCPDTNDLNTDHLLIDCLGKRFNWLYSVFDNLPSLVEFAVWMHCETGVCPTDLQGHRHYCSYIGHQNVTHPPTPSDTLDWCCFDHQRCYRELAEIHCRKTPPTHTNYTCSHLTNNSCDSLDLCEQGFCLCDQEAIACIGNNSHFLLHQHENNNLSSPALTEWMETSPQISDMGIMLDELDITMNGTMGNFTEDFLLENNTLKNHSHSEAYSAIPPSDTLFENGTEEEWGNDLITTTHNATGLLLNDTENTVLTLVTKPQRLHDMHHETQTYTPHSDTEMAHTHTLDSMTAFPSALPQTWTNHSSTELEKDGGEDKGPQKDNVLLQTTTVTFDPTAPQTSGNPDDDAVAHLDLNTSDRQRTETESKDESKETDEDGVSVETLHIDEKEYNNEEEAKMSQGSHIPQVFTPSAASTNQILFHSVSLSLPTKQNAEATSSPTQLSPEDNRDESREKISSEDEQITETLQVTTPNKITKDQAKLFKTHTPAITHPHTTTQHLLEDEEASDTEEEHSDEDNLQMNAEVQDSIAGHITAQNAITLAPMTSDLTKHTKAKAHTPSQATSTLFQKTTNTQVTHQPSHRLTTHTSLPRAFTSSTIQTPTHTPYTSHTPLTKPTTTYKSPLTLHQSPVTHNYKTEPRPLHTHRIPHTTKPNTIPASSATTTQSYSEEEEEEEKEEEEEDEKYEEMKEEALDSSQKEKSKRSLRRAKRMMPLFNWPLLEEAGLSESLINSQSDECSMIFTQYSFTGEVIREFAALGEMLHCLTGRCPQEYEHYGCYCGQQGRGIPQDHLDQCCFHHQCCLEQLALLGCRRARKLDIKCDNGKPQCLGVSVCDRLQCVCDRTTAECMAASHFNHSVTSQCSGPRPPCTRRPRPLPQTTNDDSSQESSETTKTDSQTLSRPQQRPQTHMKPGHTQPAGGAREQEGEGVEAPEAEEEKEEEEEEEEVEGNEEEEGEEDLEI